MADKGSKIDLENLDTTDLVSKQRSKSTKYKGVKNYLENDSSLDSPDLIEVEAERVKEYSPKQKKYNFVNSEAGTTKRVGTLPYKDMMAYYIKGEKVIKGGIKHTTSPTHEDVAKKFNCSYGAITQYAAKHNWFEKRKAYREKMTSDFSFAGQMAADINCEVLSGVKHLTRKINAELSSPTFMPNKEDIVERNGKFFVAADSGELIPLVDKSNGVKPLHYSQELLNIAKTLDTVSRICNNTVQVEIDNAYLLEEEGNKGDTKANSANRMRQIEQLQQRLREVKKS